MLVAGRYLGKMSTGVGSGKSLVMQQSRCGGSVGGCVWLVVCVLMMSAWDDGDAGTFDLASDLVAAGGAASGLTRKGDDAEEIGGTWSAVSDNVEGTCEVMVRRCDGSCHHCFYSCLVVGDEYYECAAAGVSRGHPVYLLYDSTLCLPCELGNENARWETKSFFFPLAKPRTIESVLQQVTPGVGIGATTGLSGGGWKVQVVWMLEEKLAKMQIDAEITDVTSEESANPGCEEESVLIESHEVVGIYFGRR